MLTWIGSRERAQEDGRGSAMFLRSCCAPRGWLHSRRPSAGGHASFPNGPAPGRDVRARASSELGPAHAHSALSSPGQSSPGGGV